MNCEHAFVPFPDSLSKVFCKRCGVGRDAFAQAQTSPRRQGRRVPAVRAQSETPLPSPSLFDDAQDPDVEDARDLIAEQTALAQLEEAVREIVGSSNLPPEEAEEVVRGAVSFGADLDLDQFARSIAAIPPRAGTEYAPE